MLGTNNDLPRRTAIKTGVLGAAALLLSGASSGSALAEDEDDTGPVAPETPTLEEGSSASLYDNEVTAEDVENGDAFVMVDRAVLPEGGYLSIHTARERLDPDRSNDERIADSFVGLTGYMEPGVHRHVPVPLYPTPSVPGDPDVSDGISSRIDSSQPILAIPHTNQSDEPFEPGTDGAYREGPKPLEYLAPVHDVATLFFADESDETRSGAKSEEWEIRRSRGLHRFVEEFADTPYAEIEFEDQESDGTSVTVARTYLEGDGFITIHTWDLIAEQDSPGTIVGVSELLTPGEYKNITVNLFADGTGSSPGFEGQERLEGTQKLVAVPHRDVTGTGEVEFTGENGHDIPFQNGPASRDDLPVPSAVNDVGTVTVGDTE